VVQLPCHACSSAPLLVVTSQCKHRDRRAKSLLDSGCDVGPDVDEQLRRQGIEPMTSTPGEFAAFLRADIKKWGELARRTGAHVD
jgi:hypothetical protein